MNTEIVMVGTTRWAKPLEEVIAQRGMPEEENPNKVVDKTPQASSIQDRPAVRKMLDEFVSSLRDNAKVWAVCADQDASGTIHVWTCVDSSERRDRSPVYAAEWRLLSRYREVGFDFNVVLSPAGSEQFEGGTFDYIFLR